MVALPIEDMGDLFALLSCTATGNIHSNGCHHILCGMSQGPINKTPAI